MSNPTSSPMTIGVTDLDAHTGLEEGATYRVTARLRTPTPNISAGLIVKEVAGPTPCLARSKDPIVAHFDSVDHHQRRPHHLRRQSWP